MSFALRIVKEKTGYAHKCKTLGGKIQILFKDFFTLDFVKNLYIKEMKKYNNKPTELINSANSGNGYFNEILDRSGLRADECLMVGNDTSDDISCADLGMDVFLVTDDLINNKGIDISKYANGKLTDIYALLG